MQPPIEGILPAIHTAFRPDESLDSEKQRMLIRRLVSQGAHGLFVGGTSAEFPFLSIEEREQLLELVLEESAARVPIVVHVGTPCPRDAVRLARHAEKHGAAALSSVPPYYYGYRPSAVIRHVEEVASATGLPFYYYHIPARTHVELDERLFERLLAIPRVAGLKYSHGDLGLLERLLALAGPRFQVFCGSDEILLPCLVTGAVGAIGSTYNFLAPLFIPLWNAFRAGRLEEARLLQGRANRVIGVLARYPAIAGSKEALRLGGIDAGRPRSPQSQLEPGEAESLCEALQAAGFPASHFPTST